MYFKVLKSSSGGISNESSTYKDVDEVIKEIYDFRGWDTLRKLHEAVREWSITARPGCIFATAASVIVVMAPDSSLRKIGECPYCHMIGTLKKGVFLSGSEGEVRQRMKCGQCGLKWVDVLLLAYRSHHPRDGR